MSEPKVVFSRDSRTKDFQNLNLLETNEVLKMEEKIENLREKVESFKQVLRHQNQKLQETTQELMYTNHEICAATSSKLRLS